MTPLPGDLRDRLPAVLLVALFCGLYLLFLGVRPLFIPDEVRYGEIAREMLDNGNWIVPRLNGLLYFEKPPFGHWLNAVSLFLFGENAFAVRLGSALCTGISAFTVYFLGRLLFESKKVAYLAVFVFLTTLVVQGVGTYAVLDAIFSAALNAGIAVFILASTLPGRRRVVLMAVSGLCLGIGFLTKGLLAFALPFLVLTPWLIWNRQSAFLFRYGWITVCVAIITVVPWALAIHIQQPDFWRYFFWVEHVQRFAGEDAQHKAPWFYYLLSLPLAAFPWIFLLPAALSGTSDAAAAARMRGAMSLLTMWVVIPFVFFSVASGKLLTYILPCFVPFSLIIASGLYETASRARLARAGLIMAAAILLSILAGLVFVHVRADELVLFRNDELSKFIALCGALVSAIAILVFGARSQSVSLRRISGGLAMTVLLATLPWVMPERTLERKAPVSFLSSVAAETPKHTIIVVNGSLVRAASWAFRRNDLYAIDDGGETAYGLGTEDGRHRLLSPDTFAEMLHSGANVLLLCKGPCKPETLAELPADASTRSYGNFNAHFSPAAAK